VLKQHLRQHRVLKVQKSVARSFLRSRADLESYRDMGRLACPCLNVSVHCKGSSWDSRPVAAVRLFPERSSDRLTGETVCEIELDVAGVTTVSEMLIG